MASLEKNRKAINQIDDKIVALLAARLDLVRKIGVYKKKNSLPELDSNHFLKVIDRVVLSAKKSKIPQSLVRKIWEEIHEEALKIEKNT